MLGAFTGRTGRTNRIAYVMRVIAACPTIRVIPEIVDPHSVQARLDLPKHLKYVKA